MRRAGVDFFLSQSDFDLRAVVGAALCTGLLLSLGAFCLQDLREFDEGTQFVLKSLDVRLRLEKVLNEVRSVDSFERAKAGSMNANGQGLAIHSLASREVFEELEHLGRLLRDDPDRAQKLRHLQSLVREKLVLARTHTERRERGTSGGSESASGMPESEISASTTLRRMQLMDDLSQHALRMIAQESLAASLKTSSLAGQSEKRSLVVGIGLLFVLAVACITVSSRDLSKIDALKLKLKGLDDELSLVAFFSSGCGIVRLDGHGIITDWPADAYGLLGYVARDMRGRSYSLLYSEKRTAWADAQDDLRIAALQGWIEKETEFVERHGKNTPVALLLKAVYDAQGATQGFSLLVRDLSATRLVQSQIKGLKLSEKAARAEALQFKELSAGLIERLVQSESSFQMFADALRVIAWTSTPEGKPLHWNRHWFDYTGLSLEETQSGAGWTQVLHHDDADTLLESWQRALNTGTYLDARVRLRHQATGFYRWHVVRMAPVCDAQGERLKWVGLATPVDLAQLGVPAALPVLTVVHSGILLSQ